MRFVKIRKEFSFNRLHHAGTALDFFMDKFYLLLFIKKPLDVFGNLLLKRGKLFVHDLLNEINYASFEVSYLLLEIGLLFLFFEFYLIKLIMLLLFFVRLLIEIDLWTYIFFLESIFSLKLLDAARIHFVSLKLLYHHFRDKGLALVDKSLTKYIVGLILLRELGELRVDRSMPRLAKV